VGTSKIQGLEEEIKLFPYLDKFPKLGKNVFLASGVKIAGEVEIGNDSSIWYNTVIRGDVHFVKIGKMTNVQDSSTLHVTNGKFPLVIGDKVTIGHSVVLHGCTLKDLSFIGIRAVVLDGAVVEEHSMVAAGSVVIPGFVVPSGKLVAGVPAKVIRDLKKEELEDFEKSAERYVKYAQLTQESFSKSD
jgi:gamma-carbonic anhydrase